MIETVQCDYVEYREWDSAFFNQKIYSINADDLHKVSFAHLKEQLSGALIQVKIPADRADILDLAQRHHFKFVESEIIFSKNISENGYYDTSNPILDAQIKDTAAIQKLAGETFTHSRFKAPWFHKNDAARIYSEWGKKAITHHYDDVCLKAVSSLNDESLYGLVTAKQLTADVARIGLICVSQAFQNKNFGSILLKAIENWSLSKGMVTLCVSTQGANQRACRFYLRNHYQLDTMNYWFYLRVPS